MFLNKIRKKLGLYDLRLEGIKWVRKNIGENMSMNLSKNTTK